MEDLSAWRAAGQELLDGPFSLAELTATINRYERFIEAEAAADPTISMYGTFAESVLGIRSSISAQRERLEALIAEWPAGLRARQPWLATTGMPLLGKPGLVDAHATAARCKHDGRA